MRIVLPTWMHSLLGTKVEASEEERLDAQEELQNKLDGAANNE